ncbi:uncharacterized protein LOC133814819 [Humulus lupulus]|uniref:uncharacterized protein LOC133814819 n=1 Tax=Humulus lupulus TaxID=3486 RepID=UPI002B410C9D|nr:uncharacterized protein LOC133814819 [Humulus lupulus]
MEDDDNVAQQESDPWVSVSISRGMPHSDDEQGPVSWANQVETGHFQESGKAIWAKFKESLPSYGGMQLQYSEPMHRDGQIITKLDLEEIKVEASFWKSALIFVVIGANPPLAIFERFIKRIWGKLGIERVARLNSSFTMVKFCDEATRDLVLEAGVAHFDKKPVILRPWTTDLDSLRLVKTIPVWIRLPELGLQYWGVKCLSALVSTNGKPIMVDKITKDRTMLRFSRVLVDMEIADQLPQFINYLNKRGQVMEQPIEYEWLPTKCSNFKKLGHSSSSCKFEARTVWRKKESQNILEPVQQKVEDAVNLKQSSAVMIQKPPQAEAPVGAGSSDTS